MIISTHFYLFILTHFLTKVTQAQSMGRMVIRKDQTVDKQARLEIIQAKQRAMEAAKKKKEEDQKIADAKAKRKKMAKKKKMGKKTVFVSDQFIIKTVKKSNDHLDTDIEKEFRHFFVMDDGMEKGI